MATLLITYLNHQHGHWRLFRRRTTRRRQRLPRPGRSTPARAPDLDARAAPAETAPWQRFTTVGDATRRDTRPSTALRSCTREAGVPGASRSPTGRTIAGSMASRCDENLRLRRQGRKGLFCFLCCATCVRSDWFLTSIIQ